jgi:membrane fusion protein (multidrug efflux system)
MLSLEFMRKFIRIACISSLFCLSGCHKAARPAMPPIPVTVIRVEPQTIPANFEYIGVGESSHIVELRARVEGYLQSIDYKEGGFVTAGDPMFVLDRRPFIASVDSAKGALAQKKAVLWNAEQTKARMVPLYKQNAVSQRDLDNAISDQLSAQANVETAQADLDQANLNLGFASLSAPVTGIASQAKYREGALISPGEQSLLTTIYVLDPIWVNFSIAERDLLQFRQDIKAGRLVWPKDMNFEIEAILSDGTVVPATGFIDFTNPALQQNTGTMSIRSVLPNPNFLIYPGQFVRVVVKGGTRPNAMLVPQTAVIQGESGTFVYVVESGQARAQPVKAGAWYKDYWIINEGLKSGDVVITIGVNKIQTGSHVTIHSMMQTSIPNTGN